MKKKFLLIFLSFCACVACAFALSACNLFSDESEGGGADNTPHVHTLQYQEERSATCTAEGRSKHWYCTSCGGYFSDENGENQVAFSSLKIDKVAHTIVTDEAVEKTCTTDGLTEGKHCSVCNQVLIEQKVVPKGHVEVVIDAIAKGCEYAGSTEGRKCSVCNTVTLEPQIIPAGHTLVNDDGRAATCTEAGLTAGKHCTVCSYVEAQTVIPAKGHTRVEDDAVAATCTATGLTAGAHCADCEYVYQAQSVVPANGHSEVVDEAVAAGCLTQGLTAGKHCTVCGEKTVRQEFISALGHVEVIDSAVPATCLTGGKTAGKHCSRCNEVLVAQQTVNKLNHSGSGNLCSTCGELLVEASDGLTFRGITALPVGVRNVRRAISERSLDIIGFEVTGRGTFIGNNLVIPSTHDGLPVLGIADEAFKLDGLIIYLTIPNSVKYIGFEAFAYCRHINEINIADSVEIIRESAFRGDGREYPMITSFSCPENLREVTAKMLASAIHLEWVYIPKSVTKVDLAAFAYCSSLVNIYFEGTQAQWESVKESWADGVSAVTSFYSETAPTGAGNYWHYDASGNPVRW